MESFPQKLVEKSLWMIFLKRFSIDYSILGYNNLFCRWLLLESPTREPTHWRYIFFIDLKNCRKIKTFHRVTKVELSSRRLILCRVILSSSPLVSSWKDFLSLLHSEHFLTLSTVALASDWGPIMLIKSRHSRWRTWLSKSV